MVGERDSSYHVCLQTISQPFTKHDETTAPQEAAQVMAMAKVRDSFIANLAGSLAAGYRRAQVIDVIMGVVLKTMANYNNHLAGAKPNVEFVAMTEAKEVAWSVD